MEDEQVVDDVKEAHLSLQVNAMEEFQSALNISPKRICYTITHVEYALTVCTPETIIISELDQKSPKAETRKRFQLLHEDAVAQGVNIVIVYAGHNTYDAVNTMGGVCAILKYKIEDEAYPDLEL